MKPTKRCKTARIPYDDNENNTSLGCFHKDQYFNIQQNFLMVNNCNENLF